MHQKYLAGSSRHCQQELESAQAELLQNLCGTMLATLQEVHTQLSTSYKFLSPLTQQGACLQLAHVPGMEAGVLGHYDGAGDYG
jgi:hypothetical protein